MQKFVPVLVVALFLCAAGCSKSSSAGPVTLTPEQIDAANKEQLRVEGEEKAHQKATTGARNGKANSVDEEYRRARGGR